MKLVTEHRKLGQHQMEQLATHCLVRIQELHPTNWKTIMNNEYRHMVEVEMTMLKTADPYEAVIPFYNAAKDANHKVWWLATAKMLVNEKKLQHA
jgi:hypothetical protein